MDDLHRLSHRISYTETLFLNDKWAEWAQNHSSIIPSNIAKKKIVTHVFDNIDWQNKNGRIETHHTNSTIVPLLRTGNWEGYLEAIFQFLPYCFRLNHFNYARNLSFYYVHMRSLKEENKEAYEYLQNGGFSGSLSGSPHSRIPFGQVIGNDC